MTICCLAPALLGLVLTGCYTDPINRKPTVSDIAIEGSEPLHRNQFRIFVVTADDDGGAAQLDYRWGQAATCPATGDVAAAREAMGTADVTTVGPSHDVHVVSMERFCLWVVVSDRFGASATTSQDFQPVDRMPEGRLVLVDPTPVTDNDRFPLFTKFRIASDITDPDEGVVALTWSVAGPKGPVTAAPCGDALMDRCFEAVDDGVYKVVAKTGPEFQRNLDVLVLPDQPPCLTSFDPAPLPRLLRRADDPLTFQVAVSDDGDPLPPTDGRTDVRTELHWSVRIDGQTQGPLRLSLPLQAKEYFVPANTFSPLQRVQISVEARDRAHGPPDPSTCNAAGTECTAMLPGNRTCLTRATWTVEFDL